MAKKKTIEEILAGVPPAPDPSLPDSMTGLNRGYEPQVPVPSREMQLEGILNRDPQQRANERYEEYMGKGAGRVGKKALDIFLAALSGFGTKGNQYYGKKQTFLDEERETFKQKAPLAQQELNTLRTTQQRESDSIRDATTADNKLKEQAKQAARALGIKEEVVEQHWSKIRMSGPLIGWQTALAKANAESQQLKNDVLEKTGMLPGNTPTSVNEATAVQKNPSLLGPMFQTSLAKGGPQILRQAMPQTSTSQGTRWLETQDSVGGGTQMQPFPTMSRRESPGNPLAAETFKQFMQGNFGQGSQAQGTSQFEVPQNPFSRQLPVQTPTVPAPIRSRPTATTGTTKFGNSVFIPPDHYNQPTAQGGVVKARTKVEKEQDQKRFVSRQKVSQAVKALNTIGPEDLEQLTDLMALEGYGALGKGVAEIRRRTSKISPVETTLREALAGLSIQDIVDFTGKQSSQREYDLIKDTIPGKGDSPKQLVTKLFTRQLLLSYWSMRNEGDRGSTNWGIADQHRLRIDEAFNSKVNRIADSLASQYVGDKNKGIAPKPIDPSRLNARIWVEDEIDKITKGLK